jgi:hypothetical protein
MRTAVGLARSAKVDLRFFLPPAPVPPGVGSQTVVTLFREILTSLPATGTVILCARLSDKLID